MDKIEGICGQEFNLDWLNWETREKLSAEEAVKFVEKSLEDKVGNLESDSREYLGLHFENKASLKASYFVGQVWLKENKAALQIVPKRQEDVDYFKMVSECLSHPIVGNHLLDDKEHKCFHFEAEKAPLTLDQTLKDSVILLLVAQYLKELFWLCKRHLRRGFPRVEHNLTGRCKGRVLIKENINHNSTRGRFDRLYCQYQIHTMDTLENQILRAALEQSIRVLRMHPGKHSLKTLWGWANEPVNTLSGVKIRRIYPSEFHQIRYSGNLKVYKKPHALAKMILRTLGTDPNRPKEFDKVELPPYSIDMNELFERYCDFLLRINYKENEELWVGYNHEDNNLGCSCKVRPDFILKGDKKAILDAKYIYEWKDIDCKGEKRNNIYQVLAYSRHEYVKKKTGDKAEIYILYPSSSNENDKEDIDLDNDSDQVFEKDFDIPIYRVPISLPKFS